MSQKRIPVEDLSPCALEQLRILCFRANEGFQAGRALNDQKRLVVAEIANLNEKLKLTERKSAPYRLRYAGNRFEKEVEQFDSEMRAIQSRIDALTKKMEGLQLEDKEIQLWLPPVARLRDALLEVLGVHTPKELFPTLNDGCHVQTRVG